MAETDRLAALEKQYCPPLDPALFHAILSDYDIGSEEQLSVARAVLDDLRQTADIEGATGFDASGTGSTSSHPNAGSRTLTDLTNVTRSTASLALDKATSVSSDDVSTHYRERFEDLERDQKHAILAEAFPEHEFSTIVETLTECDFQVEKAIDELLTQRFLQQDQALLREQAVPKGIEGFIRDDDEPRPRTGKGKRRRRANREAWDTSDPGSSESSQLMPQYIRPAPLDEDMLDAPGFEAVRPSQRAIPARARTMIPASVTAATYNAAKQEAFAKAAAAARRSRSDHLMGGAAAYYASVGRDAKVAADYHVSQAADELAERQSTASRVDLHGIDVKNAVRIASDRVQRWWDSGASEWARQGRVMGDGGFSIVTGMGKHSEGGKAKIGPAVKKELTAEGWRVQDYGGTLLISGRVRG